MLTGIIGTNDKPGWGSGRLYFRRELAMVYEGKGEALGNAKNRAEVLRIGDTVEDQNELRVFARDDLLEIGIRRLGDIGNDSVVHAPAGESVDLIG